MFGEFNLGAKKLQDCSADCTSRYQLQVRYNKNEFYSIFSIEGAVIVTSMNRFYHEVEIFDGEKNYEGNIFVGVSFKDQKDITVSSNKKLYIKNGENNNEFILESTMTSLECGTETEDESGWITVGGPECGYETETESGWITVGGPIKGSYAVKDGQDIYYDYISDFGFYVEDPCQAFDNNLNIKLNPTNRTVKDLKYHIGTDSQFWLTNIC